jgi:outer membrane cobalamin receptor
MSNKSSHGLGTGQGSVRRGASPLAAACRSVLRAPASGSSGVLVLLLCAGTAAAQTATSGRAMDPVLEEIIVTTGRSMESTLPLELARYGADLEILTEEQIRAHSFVDVSQALEMLVPGVHLTTQAGAFSYVNLQMQGSRGSDVLWTVDGIRINNRLYNSTSPADTLPSSMIERTEVLKGGHGLMYGTQAIAGVINVVTRSFSDEPDGAITVGTGSHGLMRLNGYGRGSIGDHQLVFWGSRDEADGYEIYDAYQPSSIYRKRGYQVDSVGVKYGFDFTPHLGLTVLGIHTDARLDYPSVSNVSINDREENILAVRLDYLPDQGAQFFLKGYYHSWDTDYGPPGGPTAYWGYDDFGVSAATLLSPHRNFEYHIGYDFQTYKGLDDVLLISGEREDVHAMHVQLRSTDDLSRNARFAIGARYNETGGNSATVWNASAIWDINDYLYIQGIVGSSFMLPSAENLYRIHCPTGINCLHGNPNLAPEKSESLNVSIGGRIDAGRRPLSWQLTGWNRRVDNLITSAPLSPDHPAQLPPEFTRIFVNIEDEVKVTGGELLLRGPITQALSFDVSYTYSREIARGSTEQIADRPRRQYKGSLSWSPAVAPVGVNAAFKYVGLKTNQLAAFGRQEYGDTYVVDLGAHVYLDRERRRQRLNLRVENAFDSTYATAVSQANLIGSDPVQPFMFRRLGPPRSYHLNYSYFF